MIDHLRALRQYAQHHETCPRSWVRGSHDPYPDKPCNCGLTALLKELDTLLSAPVGSLPINVSVVRCEHGGVQIEGHTLSGDWELELDSDGNVIESDGIASAPVGSGWQPIETAPTDGTWFLAWDRDCEYTIQRRGYGFIAAEEPDATHWMPLPSAPRGGGETRPIEHEEKDSESRVDGERLSGGQDLPQRATGD